MGDRFLGGKDDVVWRRRVVLCSKANAKAGRVGSIWGRGDPGDMETPGRQGRPLRTLWFPATIRFDSIAYVSKQRLSPPPPRRALFFLCCSRCSPASSCLLTSSRAISSLPQPFCLVSPPLCLSSESTRPSLIGRTCLLIPSKPHLTSISVQSPCTRTPKQAGRFRLSTFGPFDVRRARCLLAACSRRVARVGFLAPAGRRRAAVPGGR